MLSALFLFFTNSNEDHWSVTACLRGPFWDNLADFAVDGALFLSLLFNKHLTSPTVAILASGIRADIDLKGEVFYFVIIYICF